MRKVGQIQFLRSCKIVFCGETVWLIIWFTPLWHNLKLGVIYASFSGKFVLPKFQSLQKQGCLASLAQGKSTLSMTRVKGPLFVYFFSFTPSLPLLLTYHIILCIKTNHYLQKIAQQMDIKKPVFAIAVLQAIDPAI